MIITFDYFCFKKRWEDKELISHDMSSSSKFSHHNDYPRLHWLIPLWLLLLHHHSFACFNSISNFSSRSFFNSHVSVFLIQSYPNCFSSSFFSHIWLSVSSSLFTFFFVVVLNEMCKRKRMKMITQSVFDDHHHSCCPHQKTLRT